MFVTYFTYVSVARTNAWAWRLIDLFMEALIAWSGRYLVTKIRVLIYSGDIDACVPNLGSQMWTSGKQHYATRPSNRASYFPPFLPPCISSCLPAFTPVATPTADLLTYTTYNLASLVLCAHSARQAGGA